MNTVLYNKKRKLSQVMTNENYIPNKIYLQKGEKEELSEIIHDVDYENYTTHNLKFKKIYHGHKKVILELLITDIVGIIMDYINDDFQIRVIASYDGNTHFGLPGVIDFELEFKANNIQIGFDHYSFEYCYLFRFDNKYNTNGNNCVGDKYKNYMNQCLLLHPVPKRNDIIQCSYKNNIGKFTDDRIPVNIDIVFDHYLKKHYNVIPKNNWKTHDRRNCHNYNENGKYKISLTRHNQHIIFDINNHRMFKNAIVISKIIINTTNNILENMRINTKYKKSIHQKISKNCDQMFSRTCIFMEE